MSKISGKNGRLRKGSAVVAEITEWSMSGIAMPVVTKDPAFSDTVANKEATGVVDPGTISCRGNYDPADTTGQQALETACAAGTHMTDLYLYVNTSTFWRVGTGGFIICTKAKANMLPRNGFGTCSFEFEVSDAAMEQVGTGS